MPHAASKDATWGRSVRGHREDEVSRGTSTRSPPTFLFSFSHPPTPAKQKKEEEEEEDDDDDDDYDDDDDDDDAVLDNTRGYRFSR